MKFKVKEEMESESETGKFPVKNTRGRKRKAPQTMKVEKIAIQERKKTNSVRSGIFFKSAFM